MTERPPATMRHRILAVVIDSALGGAVAAVVSGIVVALSVLSAGAVSILLLAPVLAVALTAWFFVYTALQGGRGSFGMRFMGLRLEHAADDAGLGFGRALGRNLVWAVTSSVVVGLFSPLFDASRWRRGWHDFASGAVMIDAVPVPAPRPPATVEAVPAHVEPVHAPVAAAVSAPVAAATPEGGNLPAPAWAPASVPPNRRMPRTLPVDVISTVPGVPHREGRPTSAERAAPPVIAILRWDDGTRHTVYEDTLFGRGPGQQAGRASVPVRDETLSLSKTHFEIGADDAGTWVLDRHSLNGVVIVRGGQPQRLVPGTPARIWSGDALELGDRRLTVETAR
ncbi:RDD family protein [Microbacterium sp. MM2322]|uniref:RDD family protein n=1 Tax=Microbacterium sp. MM2322 TaxID=3157631 RepID=UPI0032D5880B